MGSVPLGQKSLYHAKQSFFLDVGLISNDPSIFRMLLIEFLFDCIMTIQSDVFSGSLNPEKFTEFKLVKKTQISPNTAKFTFALPRPTSVLGLPVGKHILCRFK